jgi:hypothetical protein
MGHEDQVCQRHINCMCLIGLVPFAIVHKSHIPHLVRSENAIFTYVQDLFIRTGLDLDSLCVKCPKLQVIPPNFKANRVPETTITWHKNTRR